MTCHHAIRTEPQFRVRNQTPDPPVLNPSSSSRSLLLPPPPPPRIKTNKKETQKEKENEEHQTLETLERELPPWSEACPSASSRFSPASPSSSSPGSVLSTSRFSSVSSSSSSHSLFLLFLSKCWVFFFLGMVIRWRLGSDRSSNRSRYLIIGVLVWLLYREREVDWVFLMFGFAGWWTCEVAEGDDKVYLGLGDETAVGGLAGRSNYSATSFGFIFLISFVPLLFYDASYLLDLFGIDLSDCWLLNGAKFFFLEVFNANLWFGSWYYFVWQFEIQMWTDFRGGKCIYIFFFENYNL